jgi:hypothetical protein
MSDNRQTMPPSPPPTPHTHTHTLTPAPAPLQVTSPVFQDLPRLPTPLGSFVHTNPYFTKLSLQDRATALPLVKALLEFDCDEATYMQYDTMSAYELFR